MVSQFQNIIDILVFSVFGLWSNYSRSPQFCQQGENPDTKPVSQFEKTLPAALINCSNLQFWISIPFRPYVVLQHKVQNLRDFHILNHTRSNAI